MTEEATTDPIGEIYEQATKVNAKLATSADPALLSEGRTLADQLIAHVRENVEDYDDFVRRIDRSQEFALHDSAKMGKKETRLRALYMRADELERAMSEAVEPRIKPKPEVDHGDDHDDHHHHHAMPLPHEYPVDTQYGRATMGKIGMWIFLLSDAFSFGGLLLAYAILRGGAQGPWIPKGQPALGINFTAVLTFILICSSVSMVMAYAAAAEGDKKGTQKWLLITIGGGLLFLGGQVQEYWGIFHAFLPGHGLLNEGLDWGTSHYATTFYAITGFHGMHVTIGVIYLSITLLRSYMGKFDDGNYNEIEIVGLFWHFVDLVWILVFTFIYLI